MPTYTLPAGTYFIGDPCYVFPHSGAFEDAWGEFLESLEEQEKNRERWGEIHDHRIYCSSTAFGDGAFWSNIGIDFCVDSGMIGIVPMELVEMMYGADLDLKRLNQLGKVHSFEKEFEVEFGGKGFFSFDNIVIDTTDEENCDFDDEE